MIAAITSVNFCKVVSTKITANVCFTEGCLSKHALQTEMFTLHGEENVVVLLE